MHGLILPTVPVQTMRYHEEESHEINVQKHGKLKLTLKLLA